MNKNIKLTVILCLLFVAVVFLLTYLRIVRGNAAASISPEQLREIGALVYEKPVALRDFTLLDHNGQLFDKSSLTGQWSLLFFGFTSCPDICPLTMYELSRFYRSEQADPYRADTDIVLVSVDPFRDTPERLQQYVTGFSPDFLGVTGEYGEIAQFARQLFVAHSEPPVTSGEEDNSSAPADYSIDHSGNIMIINPRGEYHGFLEGGIQADNIARAYSAIRAASR